MDTRELEEGLVARERFAPDPADVLHTVLAHPPTARVKRSNRRFAMIGIAAAVILVVGSVSVVRSTAHVVSTPPAPTAPSPPPSALGSKLVGTYWSMTTISKGLPATPLSATSASSFSLMFNQDGTVESYSRCQVRKVRWTATDLTVTIGKFAPAEKSCPVDTGDPGPAAALLAAALPVMTTGPMHAHLEGRSLVLDVGTYALAFWYGGREFSSLTDLKPPSVDAAVQQWAGFPITASPRPVVLMTSAIVLPGAPLPDGQQENALAAGRIVLETTPPTAPATIGGYPILTAQAAIAQFTGPLSTSVDRYVLHITKLQLLDRDFRTDRGDVPLPTWKVTLAESHDPIYVLAVAAPGRYPAALTDSSPIGEDATVSGNGLDVTISFIAHHVSQGGCDTDRTATFASKETSTSVVMAVSVHFEPPVPRPGCTNGFGELMSGYPDPGEPDTKTVHLRQPLGNRVVVNESGEPYVIHTP